MTSLHIAGGDEENGGDFCLEGFDSGNRRLTVWVNKDGTIDCFVHDENGQRDMSMYEGLRWLRQGGRKA